MTYLALKRNSKIKTAIVGNGVSDLLETPKERPDMETNVYAECIPNYWENKEEKLKKRSVLYWVDELPKNSSLLLLCGSNDEHVNPEHSRKLAAKLDSINYNYEFKEFETNHRFAGKREELDKVVIEWFDIHLNE